MRKTKIICTLGPSCEDEATIRDLIMAGMDVARFNMSHGELQSHKEKYEIIDRIRNELGVSVATMLDTKGPEIRLRDIVNGKAYLECGSEFALTVDDIMGDSKRVSISYKGLLGDLKVGSNVMIDDGLIEMIVEKITKSDIICRVINGGYISNHKGINVPGTHLSMPYLSSEDERDIMFAINMGFDYIAASFVRKAEDVQSIRKILDSNGSKIKIIAKIESVQGIENLNEIIDVSDGIMVARGDMGVEIPFEEVPVLQKKMIKKCISKGKVVITATQMLESMINNPRPTRAEVTDVAGAIYDGTTAIMLSGESAAGKYPILATETMAKIAESTENNIDYYRRIRRSYNEVEKGITPAIAYATCHTAMELSAKAIITVTMTGYTAAAISRFKPDCQIIGCTTDPAVARILNLMWGVRPLMLKKENSIEELFLDSVDCAMKEGMIKKGDIVVITAGLPLGKTGTTNTIRVVEV